MSDNHRQKFRREILRQSFGAQQTAGQLLKRARMIMGVGIEFMARQFGVSSRIWQHYENDRAVIPDVLLLKIFTFGLDFWIERQIIPTPNQEQ